MNNMKSQPIKLIVDFDGPYKTGEGVSEWVCILPQMPGMVESGKTKLEAFENMMVSLKVKLAYDNNIDLNN